MYNLPPIFAILGPQGSGKSYSAFKIACEFADRSQFDLAFNFSINQAALYRYCIACGYNWLAMRVYYNQCKFLDADDLEYFLRFPRHIYILDEAGVYLNARTFKDMQRRTMHDLAQIRHDNKILIWLAQYHDQVDKMLRQLTQGFCQCESQLRFNREMGNYKIYWQRIYIYNSRQYKIYLQKVADKVQGLKYWVNSRRLSEFHYEGMLSEADRMIFDIYQSFGARVGDGSGEQPPPLFMPSCHDVSYSETDFKDACISILDRFDSFDFSIFSF